MTESTHPIPELTDADLQAMLLRALRNVLILGAVAALAVAIGSNWRNALMLATGALISAASIWEWRRLARAISDKLDHRKTPAGAAAVAILFVLKLTIFALVIYGSLKCFHGSAAALLCGLALAVLAVGWEIVRLLRD